MTRIRKISADLERRSIPYAVRWGVCDNDRGATFGSLKTVQMEVLGCVTTFGAPNPKVFFGNGSMGANLHDDQRFRLPVFSNAR